MSWVLEEKKHLFYIKYFNIIWIIYNYYLYLIIFFYADRENKTHK